MLAGPATTLAASSSAIRPVLQAPPRPFEVLGTAPAALYLASGSDVLAVLTPAAVRLPCGVIAPEVRPFALLQPDGPITVGGGRLCWRSGGRLIVIAVVREWAPARVRPIVPRADRLAELRTYLSAVDLGVPATDPFQVIGRGPGLTPSGDDLLAGYLLGARAFGLPVPPLGELRTTVLSAALLRYAAAGLCIPEVASVIAGLGGSEPLDAAPLLRVGHTSGAALAAGVLHASGQLRGEWSVVRDHSRARRPLAGVGA